MSLETIPSRSGCVNFCHNSSLFVDPEKGRFFQTSAPGSRKRPRPIRAAPGRPFFAPSMSIASEVIFKALEVGVATYVGKSVVGQQKESKRKGKGSWFGLSGKKKAGKASKKTSSDSLDAEKAISEVLRMAEGLPALVERGGPEGKKWVKLAICLGIDLVGSGSLAVPFVGDALDLVTAPLTAAMLQALFGSSLVTIGGFVEEILPGTDAIPTATLAWLAENYGYLKSLASEEDEKS